MQNYYLRQKLLLGQDSQEKLSQATVAIVGCGALGSAVAHQLARLGVGQIILIDGDSVEEHNLSRQHLYSYDDLGKHKVDALATHLEKINPEVHCQKKHLYIQQISDLEFLENVSVLVDGLDTHASRRILDSYAKQHNLWWIHGAAVMKKGSVIAFKGALRCYDDVYAPNAMDTHCADVGVLVTVTTLVASIQAQYVLDILLGKEPAYELQRVDLETMRVTTYPIKKAL